MSIQAVFAFRFLSPPPLSPYPLLHSGSLCWTSSHLRTLLLLTVSATFQMGLIWLFALQEAQPIYCLLSLHSFFPHCSVSPIVRFLSFLLYVLLFLSSYVSFFHRGFNNDEKLTRFPSGSRTWRLHNVLPHLLHMSIMDIRSLLLLCCSVLYTSVAFSVKSPLGD